MKIKKIEQPKHEEKAPKTEEKETAGVRVKTDVKAGDDDFVAVCG